MKFSYKPSGVCSREIIIEVEGETVQSVIFRGGCSGNTQGIGALVQGMKVDDVIARLHSIRCGFKQTSCPDQLSKALQAYKAKVGE